MLVLTLKMKERNELPYCEYLRRCSDDNGNTAPFTHSPTHTYNIKLVSVLLLLYSVQTTNYFDFETAAVIGFDHSINIDKWQVQEEKTTT